MLKQIKVPNNRTIFRDRAGRLVGTFVTRNEKTICPFCFERYHVGDCEIIVGRDIKDPATQKVLRAKGVKVADAPRKDWIWPLTGAKYAGMQPRRQCPRCKRALPLNIEALSGRTVAIVGKSGSGKSHYIASLVRELKSSLPLVAGNGSYCLELHEGIGQHYFEKYDLPLFTRKEELERTRLSAGEVYEPLIYVLRLAASRSRINLVFYDSAGGDQEDQVAREDLCRYILGASAMIYLADPLSMPRVVAGLPTHLKPAAVAASRPAAQVLTGVAQSVLSYQNRDVTDKVDIPTVISISKSDLLDYANIRDQQGKQLINVGSLAFLRQADYSSGFKRADFDEASNQVKSLLSVVGPDLERAAAMFSRVAFSAVAATGFPPENGIYPDVQPRRVLDPLLWCLCELGLIKG